MILVALALGFINLCGFELLVTLILNYIMTLFYPYHGACALQYKGRKKRVPKNINELLTPRGLAYWFMDDGTSYRSGRHRAYKF